MVESTVVTTTNASATTLLSIPLANNTVYYIAAYVTARRTDSADRAIYLRNVAVYREAAGAATLQGAVDTPLTRESNTGWDATITVSGNNVVIQVSGAGSNTVNWFCRVLITKVS
jgi:hypothetical protein